MKKDFRQTYHDNKNPNKDGYKVSEQGQCMLNVIQIAKVGLLNDFLSVDYHEADKDQEPEVQLHSCGEEMLKKLQRRTQKGERNIDGQVIEPQI